MAITRARKQEIVDRLVERLEGSRSIILTDFTGIDVEEMNELRNCMRESGVEFTVVKNTLLMRAFDAMGTSSDEPALAQTEGPTALAYSTDEVAPAKVIREFAKKHDGRPSIKSGIVSGKSYTIEEILELAKLPGKEELLSRIVGSANSPISGFVTVSAAILRKVLYAVEAIRESKDNQ